MDDVQTQLNEMRTINERQEEWQDDDRYHASSRESLAQQAWARLRDAVGYYRRDSLIEQRARERLAPGGVVITYDPLNEFLPLKLVRAAYRPFQSDREWEWLFTRDSFTEMQQFFSIEEAFGFLGASKWAAPLWLFNPKLAREVDCFWIASMSVLPAA